MGRERVQQRLVALSVFLFVGCFFNLWLSPRVCPYHMARSTARHTPTPFHAAQLRMLSSPLARPGLAASPSRPICFAFALAFVSRTIRAPRAIVLLNLQEAACYQVRTLPRREKFTTGPTVRHCCGPGGLHRWRRLSLRFSPRGGTERPLLPPSPELSIAVTSAPQLRFCPYRSLPRVFVRFFAKKCSRKFS